MGALGACRCERGARLPGPALRMAPAWHRTRPAGDRPMAALWRRSRSRAGGEMVRAARWCGRRARLRMAAPWRGGPGPGGADADGGGRGRRPRDVAEPEAAQGPYGGRAGRLGIRGPRSGASGTWCRFPGAARCGRRSGCARALSRAVVRRRPRLCDRRHSRDAPGGGDLRGDRLWAGGDPCGCRGGRWWHSRICTSGRPGGRGGCRVEWYASDPADALAAWLHERAACREYEGGADREAADRGAWSELLRKGQE